MSFWKTLERELKMDKVIGIDGREVKFRATARTPRLYRVLIMRDLIKDMNALSKNYKRVSDSKEGDPESVDSLSIEDLTIFENAAFVMAKQATPDMEEKTADEWLDTFNMFSIWEILPQILDLWRLNNLQTSKSKKK